MLKLVHFEAPSPPYRRKLIQSFAPLRTGLHYAIQVALLDCTLFRLAQLRMGFRNKLAPPHDPLASVAAALDPVLSLTIDFRKAGHHLKDQGGWVVGNSTEDSLTLVGTRATLDMHQIADFEPMLRHKRQVVPDWAAERAC
jgi:hypothetical protein